MYGRERTDRILEILKENGYVTVKYLTEKLHYSNATINRDLNLLESRKLVVRSYGGVELIENRAVPLEFRYHKMKIAKNHIAKRAADFIKPGDTVFIGGSTTAEGIGKFLTETADVTVVTNDMSLVAYLSEHGVKVICTGGEVTEIPTMLGGECAVVTAMKFRFDGMFFATGGISEDGMIGGSRTYFLLYETVKRNSERVFYLTDHTKLNVECEYVQCDLSEVDAVISDYRFDDAVKKKYPNTEFCEI